MRVIILVSLVLFASACERANPNVCCATEAQCAAIGVDELRPCGPGQACKDTTCVASECDTSMDCPAENPICVANVCVGSCSNDDDCADTGRPFCDEGVCVGCRSPVDCTENQPICDQQDRTCRGCRADDECISGVCIEADNVCATSEQIVHVKQFGVDSGTCTATAPCGTLGYALQQVTGPRHIIRVMSSDLFVDQAVAVNRSVILDGNGTTIAEPYMLGEPLFQISLATVTIEGFTIEGQLSTSTMPTITVSDGTLRMTKATTNTTLISATNATLELEDMQVATANSYDQPMVKCLTGTLSIRDVEFQKATVDSMNCLLTVQGSRFDGNSDGSVRAVGGKVTIENNLITESNELSDSMSVYSAAPGSVIRFNTFVNISGIDSDGVALFCDNTPDVANNIFAYRSQHPMGGPGDPMPCRARFSLFDTVAVPEHRSGEGNRISEFALIFANASSKDFHLAPTSNAKEGAQPNIVDIDLEGAPRPRPAGTNPDMGCFEGD